MLQAKNIQIGRKSCLFSIENLQLQKNCFYGLIGKNGIGKSSFLETIAGLIPPFFGSIKSINELKNLNQIAIVNSTFNGVEHLTTREYIALGRAPHTNFLGKLTSKDYEIIDDVIIQLNLLELQDKETIKLSDGEKQIASIGRALAQETELILLDEPTAFLDYENKHIILRILQNIAHQKNLCIVHSSHDLELCRQYSNRLLIIDPNTKTLNEYEVDKITKENIINIAFPSILQTTNR